DGCEVIVIARIDEALAALRHHAELARRLEHREAARRVHAARDFGDEEDEVADEALGGEPGGDEPVRREDADPLPDERVAVVERRQVDVLEVVRRGRRRWRRGGRRGARRRYRGWRTVRE